MHCDTGLTFGSHVYEEGREHASAMHISAQITAKLFTARLVRSLLKLCRQQRRLQGQWTAQSRKGESPGAAISGKDPDQ